MFKRPCQVSLITRNMQSVIGEQLSTSSKRGVGISSDRIYPRTGVCWCGARSPQFQSDGFSISEGVRRELHVLTEKEIAEQEAAHKRRARRWNDPGSWDDDDFRWSSLRGPERDHVPLFSR